MLVLELKISTEKDVMLGVNLPVETPRSIAFVRFASAAITPELEERFLGDGKSGPRNGQFLDACMEVNESINAQKTYVKLSDFIFSCPWNK